MCSAKKSKYSSFLTREESYLEILQAKNGGKYEDCIDIIVRKAKDADHSKIYEDFFGKIEGKKARVGVFREDEHTGTFAKEISKAFPESFEQEEAMGFFEHLI